jgi:hypothetical protein
MPIPTMRIALVISFLVGGLLLASCSRPQPSAAHTSERSVEQRVADLEQYLNTNAATPRLSEAEARTQYERDLADIQSTGLVERAGRDFSSRMPDATIETWTIGYFINTNVVWCDVRYRVSGKNEILQKEFGYSRKGDTNWSLIWDAHQKQ